MLDLITTTQFKKDLKRMKKRGLNLQKLHTVLTQLQQGKTLDANYRDHALTGNYIGFRECHIEPDWLLVYTIDKGKLVLVASRTGSHADLF
ncbi:type II toxin-antitoxin system YafQ family toxin [Streptococcus oralis]|uniref:YafQ toxin protein n=1 Tax=Streptococcus oralis TaxID=1303 RepID=A0A139QR33_STROR|nr:type II toxin-antitoxin system YafQ family toxin [Streptococcus oralis]KXU04972.1 YafQ toxin protein [Streptococcus oralis]